MHPEILKFILEGRSVIDCFNLHLSSKEDIREFLKVNEFDLSKPKDQKRLALVQQEALDYLRRELKIETSPELSTMDLESLLIVVCDAKHPLREQACSLVKAMNIIQHIDGRELLYHCPISVKDLFGLVEDKIERSLSLLPRAGSPAHAASPQLPALIHYRGGRKAKESVVTKLLCKRETIAAKVYDRVRFRIVTQTREGIAGVIDHLFKTVLPFNYVIPGASTNQLVSLENLAPSPIPDRDYSGKEYRVCKFVVDIPVRLDHFIDNVLTGPEGTFYREDLGTVTYVLVEFQIVDEQTGRTNDSGDSRHELYKERQKRGVLKRLTGK